MTKEEAIQAMKEGKKVTHRFFTDDEFVRQPKPEIDEYEFEDGVVTSNILFWHFRKEEYWNDGWEIFNDLNQ